MGSIYSLGYLQAKQDFNQLNIRFNLSLNLFLIYNKEASKNPRKTSKTIHAMEGSKFLLLFHY